MPQTTNRTKWPVHGGAVSVQPGWFPGHSNALIYINIGINEPGHVAPRNMSHPIHPVFSIQGPNNQEYPGQFCIPQLGMPPNLDLQVGDNITIQVVELAQHGAALYSVSPIVRSCISEQRMRTRRQDIHSNRDADLTTSSALMSLLPSPKKSKKSRKTTATTVPISDSIWFSRRLRSRARRPLLHLLTARSLCSQLHLCL